MAVDATGTREKLLVAAERSFALDGLDGAQIRDIVRAAGQANDSAVHYHFGSRDGLLGAVCERQIDRMEPARHRSLAALREQGRTGELADVVASLIAPTAANLRAQDGRYFLRIMAQLAGLAGIRSRTVPPAMVGTALREQLDLLQAACQRIVPEKVALERIAIVIGMLTSALADRARQIDGGQRPLLAHARFVANLEAMIVGALSAPSPVGRRA